MCRPIFPVRAAALAPSVAAAALAWAPAARAGIFVSAELDAAQSIDMPAGSRPGYGFATALAYRIGLGRVFVQPEAQGGYLVFPAEVGAGLHVARVLGGARFGLAGKVQPALYGHAGVGWLDVYTSGPAFDAGLSLAFKLFPFFSFGGQAGYNVVIASGAAPVTLVTPVKRWASYGVHVAVDF